MQIAATVLDVTRKRGNSPRQGMITGEPGAGNWLSLVTNMGPPGGGLARPDRVDAQRLTPQAMPHLRDEG
jgi:hypothetical protein